MAAPTNDDTAPLSDHLGAQEAAMARSRAYGFLGDLVAGPLDAALFEQVQQVPELAAAARNSASGEPYSLDELAAAHYELFGMQVYPYAGVFLGSEALAGGDRVADMERRYRHWGFDSESEEGQDHFACQLHFMAHLSALELGARAGADWPRVAALLGEAREYLDAHILPWALPLMCGAAAEEAPLYSEVVTMAIFVACDHRGELGKEAKIAAPAEGPDPAEMLAHAKTSIRDIAEFLLTPSRSGCWISKTDIQKMGREFDVPRGFGSRVQLLSNLLRNAAEYELADRVLKSVDSLLASQQTHFVRLSEELGNEGYATHWLQRLEATRSILDAMARALPTAREADEQ